MQHVGLTVPEKYSEPLVKILQPRRPPMSLNIRNSKLSDKAFDHLCKCIDSSPPHEVALTGLSLKFCFLTFDHCMQLANALRFNKTLIKLGLSNNGLKSCTAAYILDALTTN